MAAPQPSLSPISFFIKPRTSKGFKSIQNVTWNDIPGFAVLTGRNGSGKSQLLLYLAHTLNHAIEPPLLDMNELELRVEGAAFEPGEVAYVPNSGGFIHDAGISMSNLPGVKQQAFNELRQGGTNINFRRRVQWATKVFGKKVTSMSQEEFLKLAPDDLTFMLEDQNPLHGLAHVFFGYRLQIVYELEKGLSKAEAEKKLGPAPWDVLNEILTVAEFPYRVQPPNSPLLDMYLVRLVEGDTSVNPNDLSSGEKVILQLALWLYNSRHHNHFPKLFLLDEPDAHLHPSMTRQFMDVVQQVLVERYNVRVILTTHSPSTVALAPEGSVFEMSRGAPYITPSSSRANAIGLLTAGLVVVSPTTRFVLVEDEMDVSFYDAIRDILSDYGPSRDYMALKPAPSIAFVSVSIGRGASKISGGKDNVRQWVEKLDSPPFDQLVRGLIDRDSGNASSQRMLVLGRYSIENYLVDPFVVFGLLIENNTAPKLSGISITSGDEHLIRGLSNSLLQEIVKHIRGVVDQMLPNPTSSDFQTSTVEFTNGRVVQYPKWMIDRKGHDLLPLFQSAFGGPNAISPPRLLRSLQRVRLIPKDLATLLSDLQMG